MSHFFVICSAILCLLAPESYSYGFCWTCFLIFVAVAYKLIKNDIRHVNLVNFNLIYLFSFFFCTYAFPVFLLPMGETGYLYKSSVWGIEESAINICTALSTLAISVYACGYFKKFQFRETETVNLEYNIILLDVLLVLVTVAFVISTIMFMRVNTDSIAMTDSPFLLVIYYCLLIVSLIFACRNKSYSNSLCGIFKNNKLSIVTSFIIVLLMLFMGDRGPIISIGLIYLGVYSLYIRKIKMRTLLLLCLLGVFLISLIGMTRAGDSSLKTGGLSAFLSASKEITSGENQSIWLYFSDFTNRYIELYSGYYYKQHYGELYPAKIFSILVSPIPLLPNILSEMIYGKPFLDLSSVKAINGIVFTSRDGWFGTHCVMDIFMSWGVLGIILFSYIQGLVFGYVASKCKTTILFSVLYIMLISKALYLPRAVFYEWYRPFVWILVVYICVAKKEKKNMKQLL